MRYEVRHDDEPLAWFDDRDFAFAVADRICGYGELVGRQENIRVVEVEAPFSGAPMPGHPEHEDQSQRNCLLKETFSEACASAERTGPCSSPCKTGRHRRRAASRPPGSNVKREQLEEPGCLREPA
jgi:hypothetical protein